MQQEQLVKDIIFAGQKWSSCRDKAEEKLLGLLPFFSRCQQCGAQFSENDIIWVIEELSSGLIVKKCAINLLSVCSLKCLFDRGLKKKAYYSLVVRLACGEVLSTGFRGLNALAINEFAKELSRKQN